MNRAQKRQYIKRMNTPQKLENFSQEMDRRLRIEYEKKSDAKIQEFIKCYTILFAYILDYELENEKNLRISARKNKDTSKQIAKVVKNFMNSVQKHLDLLYDETIKIDDIEKYFKEERDIEFDFNGKEIL